MYTIFLALGSNVGDKKRFIEQAIALLKEQISDVQVASLYETKPMYYAEQDNFVNTVLSGSTMLSPEELLAFTQSVEKQVGRIKRFPNGPREIDVDILFYADFRIQSERLEIAHPRIQERDFVLLPLSEIAGNFVHPILKKSIQSLLDELPDEKRSVLVKLRGNL